MTTALRAVGLAELDVLAALHAAAFEEPWSAVAFGELLSAPGSFALLAEAVSAREDACQALGFVVGRAGGGECEILTLAVLPAVRRRKVGSALLSAALEAAARRGAAEVFLEVAADNEGARALYLGHGFAVVARRKRYYQRASGGSADALVMRRAQPSEK